MWTRGIGPDAHLRFSAPMPSGGDDAAAHLRSTRRCPSPRKDSTSKGSKAEPKTRRLMPVEGLKLVTSDAAVYYDSRQRSISLALLEGAEEAQG